VEKVYQDALEVEFQKRGIKYEREKVCQICYKGITLNHTFQPDFICFDGYIVELKAMSEIDNIARAQTINYMHATKMKNALLINFGEASLKFERFIN
jgi:GxxExxY protein